MTIARPSACYLIAGIISFVSVTQYRISNNYCIPVNDLVAIQANKFKNLDWKFCIMLPLRVTD